MPFVTAANALIHYQFHTALHPSPETETIVLIHGLGFDMTSWDLVLPYFLRDYHVLTYDLQGHGFSQKGKEPVTVQRLIHDLTVVTQALNLQQFHVVGHGAGSIVAMLIDVYDPGKVKTLTLLSVPVFLSLNTAEKFTAYRRDLIQCGSLDALADHLIANVTLLDPASAEVKKLYESFYKVCMDTYVEYWDGFVEIHKEIFDLFKRNNKPVLIMTGDLDPLYPPHMSGLHTSYIPNSRYLSVFNSSNMVFVDQPKETFENIHRFINNQAPNRSRSSDPYIVYLHSEFNQFIEDKQKSHVV